MSFSIRPRIRRAFRLALRRRDLTHADIDEELAMQMANGNLPYANVQTLDDVLAPEIRPWRTGATLFSLFGGLALEIAAVGLYSAISYGVAQRRHEFGVRIALGARIRDVVWLVMGRGMWAAVIGIVLGSVAAVSLGGAIAPLLFRTSPREPSAFATAAVVITVVAALASFVFAAAPADSGHGVTSATLWPDLAIRSVASGSAAPDVVRLV